MGVPWRYIQLFTSVCQDISLLHKIHKDVVEFWFGLGWWCLAQRICGMAKSPVTRPGPPAVHHEPVQAELRKTWVSIGSSSSITLRNSST